MIQQFEKAERNLMAFFFFLRIATKTNLGKPDAVVKIRTTKRLQRLFTAAHLWLDRHCDERVAWDAGARFAPSLPVPDVVSQCKCEMDELIQEYLSLTDRGVQWL